MTATVTVAIHPRVDGAIADDAAGPQMGVAIAWTKTACARQSTLALVPAQAENECAAQRVPVASACEEALPLLGDEGGWSDGGTVSGVGTRTTLREATPEALLLMWSNPKLLASSISLLLHEWLDARPAEPPYTIFVGLASVSIEVFLENLVSLNDSMTQDSTIVLLTLTFIRRLMVTGEFAVTWKNIYRLLLAGMLTALKYHEDEILYNQDYAGLIGLPKEDVNRMELQFLSLLRFELYISVEEYGSVSMALIPHANDVVRALTRDTEMHF